MNKKKLIQVLITFTIAMVFITACGGFLSKKAAEPASSVTYDEEADTFYQNGIFIGYSDASDHGYAMAVVTLEDDKLIDVVLKEFTELSTEKDFSIYEYAPSVRAHEELPAAFMAAKGPDIEEISGATASCDRYKQAVERALESAAKELPEQKMFDGIFQGRSKSDNHGYGIALVTIEGDKITDVEIKEVDEKGELKDFNTYPYEPSRKAYREIPQRFIQKNSPEIDIFTGATHSTEKYMEAVANALHKATIDRPLPDLLDGTYIGRSDADALGYAEARVTIENSEIADVKLTEYVKREGQFRERDVLSSSYDPLVNAFRELPWSFIQAQSSKIDAVSGATRSSEFYIQAVERALLQAQGR
jgi:uncharacterized protein with FMN-binding domain